jgi:selenoprotein W-related protein
LADAIEDRFGIKAELVKSDGGAFEVFIDGDKIYSKLQAGRFPEHEEIFGAIEKVKT